MEHDDALKQKRTYNKMSSGGFALKDEAQKLQRFQPWSVQQVYFNAQKNTVYS